MEIENYSKDCELVIGLVSPVGVNLDDVQNRLQSYFDQFKYTLNYIHLSKVAESYLNGFEGPMNELLRLDRGMETGNNLRHQTGHGDIFSLLAINEINAMRRSEKDKLSPLKRHAHVIRSLKHPEEVETLRQVYGAGFILLGISSSIESRKIYLKNVKGVSDKEIDRLIDRDDKEKDPLGQSTRDVFQMADAFITSDSNSLSNQIGRILDLLFSKPVISPTPEEYAMFMAYAASLRSADLSRQVGAVLANERNDIIATGANDVPKYGGGLYWPDDNDQRDYIRGSDSNEEQKNNIIINIMKKLSNDGTDDAELLLKGKNILKDTGLLDITEYGRAVHAEMEALLSSARNGISTIGTTLYTTTYPCHNCAKHIVASGIKNVTYIEPYPKSYATILHSDSIDANGGGKHIGEKVLFEPFVGIGPRRFVDLFSMALSSGRKLKRKENGKLKQWSRPNAELRVPMAPISYIEAETILVSQLDSLDIGKNNNEK